MSHQSAPRANDFDVIDDVKIHRVGNTVRIKPIGKPGGETFVNVDDAEEFVSAFLEHAQD